MANNNQSQTSHQPIGQQSDVIAEKIKHLQQSYADFLHRMHELEKLEQAEVNKILTEIDQIKIQKTLDKISQAGRT